MMFKVVSGIRLRAKMFIRGIQLIFLTMCLVNADINMHNPRGSNNRQDESGRNRANANRLFDSQNNNRGGHNVGPSAGEMYFYSGSQLTIQWANQHSCADENNNCQVVIQYMCGDNLRDGTTTQRAPTTCSDDCDTNEKYGHHESLNYYESCYLREQNGGLFTADQRLGGDTAIYTRQNRNGNRYGYECPEERDYYPYFGDSPWKDIAIMTNDQTVCDTAREYSQNVRSRWVCTFDEDDWDKLRGKVTNDNSLSKPLLYLDKASCEQVSFVKNGQTFSPKWVEIPSHGIPAPECIDEQFSRDNHQGNTIGGEFLEYNWTIPELDEARCTVRIRYNISTDDFPFWTTDHTKNIDVGAGEMGPEEIYEVLGLDITNNADRQLVRRRQYYLKNDPQLDVFNLISESKRFNLRLALDTAQYGRTFQDRSHSFAIRPRPDDVPESAQIYNLNVRGKRGNIVQVYPSTEYDFVPTKLHTNRNDYVHIQWTGSDNNPGNNAGQGRARTDRSNIVLLRERPYAEGNLGSFLTLGTNYPFENSCEQDLFGIDRANMAKLALAGEFEVGDTPGVTLDDGEPYFDNGLLKMTKEGVYHYFSTRNNNFSNRDQKATITCD